MGIISKFLIAYQTNPDDFLVKFFSREHSMDSCDIKCNIFSIIIKITSKNTFKSRYYIIFNNDFKEFKNGSKTFLNKHIGENILGVLVDEYIKYYLILNNDETITLKTTKYESNFHITFFTNNIEIKTIFKTATIDIMNSFDTKNIFNYIFEDIDGNFLISYIYQDNTFNTTYYFKKPSKTILQKYNNCIGVINDYFGIEEYAAYFLIKTDDELYIKAYDNSKLKICYYSFKNNNK